MSEYSMAESEKVLEHIQKYLYGKEVILDIGCGAKKIVENAIGIDSDPNSCAERIINQADIYQLHCSNLIPKADVVFSSHLLEHICNPIQAIESWKRLMKPDGLMIFYLPNDEAYRENRTNRFHVQIWTPKHFTAMLEISFRDLEVVETGLDQGEGRYSFWFVLKRKP